MTKLPVKRRQNVVVKARLKPLKQKQRRHIRKYRSGRQVLVNADIQKFNLPYVSKPLLQEKSPFESGIRFTPKILRPRKPQVDDFENTAKKRFNEVMSDMRLIYNTQSDARLRASNALTGLRYGRIKEHLNISPFNENLIEKTDTFGYDVYQVPYTWVPMGQGGAGAEFKIYNERVEFRHKDLLKEYLITLNPVQARFVKDYIKLRINDKKILVGNI